MLFRSGICGGGGGLGMCDRPNLHAEENGKDGSGFLEYLMVHIGLSLIRVHGVRNVLPFRLFVVRLLTLLPKTKRQFVLIEIHFIRIIFRHGVKGTEF